MKWMRKNGFTKVSEWASFTLIGDDVRLEFDKGKYDSVRTGTSCIKIKIDVKAAMTTGR